MISHSESTVVNRAPVRLLGGALRDGGGVSRLEFHPVERMWTEPVVAAETGSEVAEVETYMMDEAAAVDVRLEVEAQMEAARREARAEAREEWEEELEERVAVERTRMLRACEAFGRERARYFAGVEAEVVKLALAIAARVLHREAKLDPLLLTGVVRVALEKVAEDSATVLRVPVAAIEMWTEIFVASPESSLQVVGDERLAAGECVLDTNVGRVELGVSAQLEEIERGFFDLMQQRPV